MVEVKPDLAVGYEERQEYDELRARWLLPYRPAPRQHEGSDRRTRVREQEPRLLHFTRGSKEQRRRAKSALEGRGGFHEMHEKDRIDLALPKLRAIDAWARRVQDAPFFLLPPGAGEMAEEIDLTGEDEDAAAAVVVD